MTNTEFGRRIGVHFTTASRLRNGQRLPSVAVLRRISKEFGIAEDELIQAHVRGGASFARLLHRHVFRGKSQ
jgi:transcriptional regulator with XRE-family HTH domain